jgi:UDP-3-O-[3-hydroxymyristoyl] glucosamine N-acyltransferase
VPYRLAELAELVGGRVEGDPEQTVDGLRALEEAGPRDLSFVTLRRHATRAAASAAGALLVARDVADHADLAGRSLLVAAHGGQALARLLTVFHPPAVHAPGVHPTAVVGAGAAVDAAAHLGPFAVVGAGAVIAAGAAVLAHAVVGAGSSVGPRTVIHPHAVLYDRTAVGADCIVHSGVVLGGDGFGYATHRGVHYKLEQVGRVVLEDGVEIGPNTTIDRAAFGETRIGAGTKIDNQVMLGHNVQVGRAAILCAQVGIAGSTRIGDGVVLGARAAAVDHVEIGDRAQAAAGTDIYHSVAAGAVVGGSPAHPIGRWRRQIALLWKLDEMLHRLRAVERRLGMRRGAAAADEQLPATVAATASEEGD